MPNDLRKWVADVERELPGHLVRIKEGVNPKFEVCAIMRKLADHGRFPAVIFENTLNLHGKPSGIKILTGASTQRKRIEVGLGIKPGSPYQVLYEEMGKRTQHALKWEKIPEKEAPVKEIVKKGEQADLRDLPMVTLHEMDGGPYFDMNPLSIDPETGRYNISWQRAMYQGPRQLGLFIVPRHLWYNYNQWGKLGKSCPVAYLVGHNPMISCSASCEVGFEVDELELAGSWLGEPLRVTPSTTWGDDFLIPADSEIVIEGNLIQDKRQVEGPFGEFTGYYGPQRMSPIMEITAINMRKNPTMLHCWMYYESNTYTVGTEAVMYLAAKRRVPTTLAVNNMYNLNAILQIKKQFEGDPKRAALGVLANDIRLKHVIVVDDDIDPFNASEVLFAIGSRVQAAKDVEIIKDARGTGLDPSMVEQNTCDLMIIDATKPVERPFQFRVKVPDEVMNKLKLEDYVSKSVLDKIPFSGFDPYILP